MFISSNDAVFSHIERTEKENLWITHKPNKHLAFLCAAVCVCVMVANTHKKALKKIQSTNSLHGVCVLCLILCTKRAKARAEIYHLLCMYECMHRRQFFPLLRIHIIIPHIINRDLFWYYGFFRFGIFCRSHSDRRFFFVASENENLMKNVKYASDDW